MGLGDSLKRHFNPDDGSTDLCERCCGLLAPAEGKHSGQRASEASKAVAAHERLVRRAWRASYPQEGGEYLYQCRDCGSWWGHVFWTWVPEEALVRHKLHSVAAWVKEWPLGEVLE